MKDNVATKLAPGVAVQLVNTGIPRLEGTRAEVLELTEWGAHVQAPAAETGRFRAHWSEMVPYDPPVAVKPRESGYTGDACPTCGSFRMRRNGACQCCEACGSTTGCS